MNFPDLFDRFADRVLPANLTDAAILQLRHEAYAEDLPAGGRLHLDDDRSHFIFVGSGATKLAAFVSTEREQIVAFDFAGDIVHVPPRGRYNFALTALTPAEVLVMPADSFLRTTPESCALLKVATEETARALSASRENAITLGRRSARERLACFLLDVWARMADQRKTGEEAIVLPMSRGEIAESLGLTIETVSRQFSELRELGLIETCGRSLLRVVNPEGLSRCAGQVAAAA
ncbi:helix-turn-helix domain-containing protein [Citromicrobium bathyomarinum]|uniref:Crp/Fnr family transcriptional regulator n=1 Tax=Citromicrobium bathyomarinum TaxID=72174 RepID=UPI003159AA1D